MTIYCGGGSANSISARSASIVAGVSPVWRRRRNHSECPALRHPYTYPPPLLRHRYQLLASDHATIPPMTSRVAPLQSVKGRLLLPLTAVLQHLATPLPLLPPTPLFNLLSQLQKLDLGKTFIASGSRSNGTGGEAGAQYGP